MRKRWSRSLAVMVVGAVGVGALTVPVSAQDGPVTVDVFVIASSSGGVFPVLDEAQTGIDAAVEAIGKEGKVEFNIETCDPKGDSSAVRACGEDALAAEPDVVLAGEVAQVGSGLVDALEAADMPVFWIVATSSRESQGDNSMVPTGNLSTFGSPGAGAAHAGFLENAVLTSSAQLGPLIKPTIVAYESAGGEIKAQVQTPFAIPGAPAPDFAPSAQKIVDEDPDVVIYGNYDLLPLLRAGGFEGPIITGEGAVTDVNALLQTYPKEVWQNYYRTGLNPPFDLKKPFPAVKDYQKALKAAGYTERTDSNAYSWNAWVYLHAIATLIEDDGITDVTSQALLDGFNNSKGIVLVTGATWVPSGPGPTNFPRQSLINYYMTKYIGEGKWKLYKTPKTGIDIPPETFNELT